MAEIEIFTFFSCCAVEIGIVMLQVSVHHSLWQSTFNWPQTSVIAVVSVGKKKTNHPNIKGSTDKVLTLNGLSVCCCSSCLSPSSYWTVCWKDGYNSDHLSSCHFRKDLAAGKNQTGGRTVGGGGAADRAAVFFERAVNFSTRALVCSFRYARLTWAWGTPAVSSHLPMPIKPCGAGSFPVIGLVSAPTMGRNLVFQLFRGRLLDVTSAPKTTFPPAAKANRGAVAVLRRSRPTPCQKKQS